jgi:hypothetical protein
LKQSTLFWGYMNKRKNISIYFANKFLPADVTTWVKNIRIDFGYVFKKTLAYYVDPLDEDRA